MELVPVTDAMRAAADEVDGPVVLGVIGTPDVVAASLSPRMFRAAFDALGIDGHYVPLGVKERAARKAMRALPRMGFRGANVTMPYKQAAAEIATHRGEECIAAGAANVLAVRRDGTIQAEATDGQAVVDAIGARGTSLAGARVTVLGAGGAALETCAALASAGVGRIDVWNRTPDHAHQLVHRLRLVHPALEFQVHSRLPIHEAAHVIVGCVPARSFEHADLHRLNAGSLVVDLAYRRDGRPTPLLEAAGARPERCVDGRELLVRQGALAFRTWLGFDPPTEVMARAVR